MLQREVGFLKEKRRLNGKFLFVMYSKYLISDFARFSGYDPGEATLGML